MKQVAILLVALIAGVAAVRPTPPSGVRPPNNGSHLRFPPVKDPEDYLHPDPKPRYPPIKDPWEYQPHRAKKPGGQLRYPPEHMHIPRIGLGCFDPQQGDAGIHMPWSGVAGYNESQTAPATYPQGAKIRQLAYEAIKRGYRAFDGAEEYGNDPAIGGAIAQAVNEGILRVRINPTDFEGCFHAMILIMSVYLH